MPAVLRPGVSSQALFPGAPPHKHSGNLGICRQTQSSCCLRSLPSQAAAQPAHNTNLRKHGQRWVPVQPVQAATAEPTSTTAPSEQGSSDGAPSFAWTSRWWPALALDDLDPKRPTHVDLIGKSLVVFGDTKGNWHCLEDRCPHRLAPLSEGRMEGDNLMCSYHGWQFNSEGKCTSIPQIDDPKAHATACSSSRSCAASYPTKKHAGLLWIWPESTPEAKLTSASAEHQPPDLPHVESPTRSAWYIREVPIRCVCCCALGQQIALRLDVVFEVCCCDAVIESKPAYELNVLGVLGVCAAVIWYSFLKPCTGLMLGVSAAVLPDSK
ncbi:Rieske [2Fe-2S] iron-sulfur domain-containing protein [Dunaliella salina]|uniref:Rieske [2Fe-2S] iron-sulfur domain-containing protein n=1 Tax=Dunaliella salina TaxID=3046 RepID=A0ABQ7GKJ4_DUNSA|nr:Rieske [2Fe-2S] iron-sulfur domain-containing protein [Dunaliella salina]|eukprot:KAF5835124.1 Rieske [2Fe-2S] iron-sulfur domain-containing protein [Dunaliella salina]